jgi:prepilin-type N-terminal cleavage/methylation domain-containing protein
MNRTHAQKGFTLVEIAIVLVIIGLLLGGILKGQEMIIQAKIKNAIADFSGISAAFYGYQDRYRATPGDDNQATRWGATVVGGNGDRILNGTYDDSTAAGSIVAANESRLWWDHLRRSGFVAGAGNVQPGNAFNGIIGVQTGNGPAPAGVITAVLANASGGFTNLIMCSSNLPDKVAIALDVQMDDGNVATGSVRGVQDTATIPATASGAFQETGTTVYTLCRQF